MADLASDSTSPDASTNVITPAPRRGITRMELSSERLAAYVRALSETGSHFAATAAATPFPNDRQAISEKSGGTTPPPSYSTFARERKINPEFREACEAALRIAVGKAEAELVRRMYTPTERVTIDKNGVIVHVALDYRNADALLAKFLAKHSPDWIEKKHLDSTATVHVRRDGDASGSGFSYAIRPSDIDLLNDDERQQLSTLIRAIEERRQPAALPSPETSA